MKSLHSISLCAVFLIAVCRTSIAAEARLLVAPKVAFSQGAIYSEESSSFYGTHIFLLESAMLRQRTEEKLGHPAPSDLKISAERIPNTSILLIRASSVDDTVAATFLSALIDQFLDFKNQQRKRAFSEQIARVDAAIKSAPPDAVAELEKVKKQLVIASLVDVAPEFEKLPEK